MDPRIIRQYLQGTFPTRQPLNYLIESSRALGSLPQNITYNGLLYTFNPQLNAFVNQFGHQISINQAAAFATSSQSYAALDLFASASDSGPTAKTTITIPPVNGFVTNANPVDPKTETLNEWDSPSGSSIISGYYIYRSTNLSPYSKIATISDPAVLAFIDTGLTTGIIYKYYITAYSDSIESVPSVTTEIELETVPFTPAGITAPSGLTASLVTSTSMRLNWTDNSNNELGFYIYRSLDGLTYSLSQAASAGVTFANIKSLTPDTDYYFKINAYGTGTTSAFSNTISRRTNPSGLTAPSFLSVFSYSPAITNYLRYTQGFTTAVSLANGGWTHAASPANSTTVSIDNSVTAPDGTTGAALLTVNNPTVIGGIHSIISQSGITASDYWTGSVWLRGKTATSGGINVVVRGGGGSQTVIPSTLKILSGPGTVVPSSVGESHWNGVTGLSKTEWTRVAWNNNSPWGTTGSGGTFTDVLLRLTVNYYNGVSPSAVTGDSIYVWGAQFERNPYASEYLAATGGSFSSRAFRGFTSQIDLYWQDNTNNETGFFIERSNDNVTFAGLTTTGANTTTYSDRGLSSGSTYYYRVRAVGFGLTSGIAGPTGTMTYFTPPAAPTNLSILSRTTNRIDIGWTDNSNNETGFYLYSSTAGVTYDLISTENAGITLYAHKDLTSGTTYYYKVNAFNPGGTSDFAGPTSAMTLQLAPTAPTGFTASSIGTNSVTLSWTDTATNEDGFNIYYRQG